jgi:hypothetical protein
MAQLDLPPVYPNIQGTQFEASVLARGCQPTYISGDSIQQQQTTVVISSHSPPEIVGDFVFRDSPAQLCCPNCNKMIITVVKYDVGVQSLLISGILLILGIWPFCLVPFVANSCKDALHICPACNKLIQRFHRL